MRFRLSPDQFPYFGEIDAQSQLLAMLGDVPQRLNELIAALLDIQSVWGNMEKTALGEIDLTVPLSQDQETLPWPPDRRRASAFYRQKFHDRATPLRLWIVFVEVAMESSRWMVSPVCVALLP